MQPTTIEMNVTTQQPEEPKQDKSKQTSKASYNQLIESSETEKVETMASLFFTTKQIAAFIGMKHSDFQRIINYDAENPISVAYHRGKMKTEIILRFDSLKFAMSGSPQALEEMKDLLIQQNLSENEE